MTTKRLSFLEQLKKEIDSASKEIQQIDKRLEEINPIWCEAWRLKKRKERLERKLKHY